MLEIGFPELMVLGALTLLVLGPERLPEVMRTLAQWYGGLRQAANRFRMELEQEVSTKEIRTTINESRDAANKLEAELKSVTNLKGMVQGLDVEQKQAPPKSNNQETTP